MNESEKITWGIIDKYFQDNPDFISKHHLDSYNDFIHNGIPRIFRENNPVKIMKEQDPKTKEFTLQCKLYLGGKDGKKIYYGKPVIYDEDEKKHYMYPNEARLRNMSYSFSIHYDIDVVFNMIGENGIMEEREITIEKQYLGRFPIMIYSDMCIMQDMPPITRFNLGECKNDPGGYFIVDGKEKVIVSQEKIANNMLNIKDKVNDIYSHAAEIRTASEDPSKPIRTLSVRIVAPMPSLKNGQIVVNVPNVRKPVPLFILMRALGIISDKSIIETCLLDMEKNEDYIDLFIPSIYDAGPIYTQETALQYISSLTKMKTIPATLHILMDYLLPNVGDLNFKQKAFYIGYMVKRLLAVYINADKPTDRDNFKYKRVELSGELMYELFLEYYKMQLKDIFVKIDSKYYYNIGIYQNNFVSLIEDNYYEYFNTRIVEEGIRKGFKGNWGAEAHTKRPGVIQTLNRLSYFSFLSHLRKLNLPLDSSAKVVGPRLLHSTQWGVICPVETPDGANIGLHKHLAITTHITSGCSITPTLQWLKNHKLKVIEELLPIQLGNYTKLFVNGNWVGCVEEPIDLIEQYRLERRNGIIPVYNSIQWIIERNEILIYTDSGRLCRPILYTMNNNVSYIESDKFREIQDNPTSYNWETLVSGFGEKIENYDMDKCKLYSAVELYNTENGLSINTGEGDMTNDGANREKIRQFLLDNASIIEYLDTSESEGTLISMEHKISNKYTTHCEIHPSLVLGIMGNMVIFPENNQLPRDLYSCGQSKQGVSIYHTNYQNRIDKMGIILNYPQIPIVKSRYLDYVTKEQHPYGENVIVAIMCYNGYNVEDALIFNGGSINRGLFRTTYFNMYEAFEESDNIGGSIKNTRFADINNNNVMGKSAGYDYNYLDKNGLIKENTQMNDKIVVIGKMTTTGNDIFTDDSVKPKKGQLGFVDKSFMTENEEGKRLTKVRIREERMPDIGDKFCSRAGQKGTVGIVIPEEDMPFTSSGIKPDIIVNPHALPSRMTIGQLVESLMGKACVLQGGYGDCTAFLNKGPKHKLFGNILTERGFHSSGTEILYNGMTGEQLESDIFIGPTYYLRLKHMVKDKINYRARGPRTELTRQTVSGRANDGGLRIGEMERDGLIAHGITNFLQESMLVRGDDYYMAICNKTGTIAIYNESKNLFLSSMADGPIQFKGNFDGTMNIENISKYGREFSIVRVPYSFKLLMQELQTMNIQMRIITEDNVEQLTNLTYDEKQLEINTGFNSYSEIVENYKVLEQKTGLERGDKTGIKRPSKMRREKPIEDFSEFGTYYQGQTQPGSIMGQTMNQQNTGLTSYDNFNFTPFMNEDAINRGRDSLTKSSPDGKDIVVTPEFRVSSPSYSSFYTQDQLDQFKKEANELDEKRLLTGISEETSITNSKLQEPTKSLNIGEQIPSPDGKDIVVTPEFRVSSPSYSSFYTQEQLDQFKKEADELPEKRQLTGISESDMSSRVTNESSNSQKSPVSVSSNVSTMNIGLGEEREERQDRTQSININSPGSSITRVPIIQPTPGYDNKTIVSKAPFVSEDGIGNIAEGVKKENKSTISEITDTLKKLGNINILTDILGVNTGDNQPPIIEEGIDNKTTQDEIKKIVA
jgi:DNA-directed RNA polymerase II subunit RPB2